MSAEWSFTASITHPDGTDVHVSITAPVESASKDVLECSELAQMGAVWSMKGYVGALADRERAASEEDAEAARRIEALMRDPF